MIEGGPEGEALDEDGDPLPCPPGWDGWSDALFAHTCASEYGWTLDEIAHADRAYVLFMRSVAAIHAKAKRVSDETEQRMRDTERAIDQGLLGDHAT